MSDDETQTPTLEDVLEILANQQAEIDNQRNFIVHLLLELMLLELRVKDAEGTPREMLVGLFLISLAKEGLPEEEYQWLTQALVQRREDTPGVNVPRPPPPTGKN